MTVIKNSLFFKPISAAFLMEDSEDIHQSGRYRKRASFKRKKSAMRISKTAQNKKETPALRQDLFSLKHARIQMLRFFFCRYRPETGQNFD
ncbi:MAG: hypothetical protein FWF95_01245 [Syntrophorhabdaceae bacterium]|nr:hypothetical protein [Syntrophorhabdaceae bacterium]